MEAAAQPLQRIYSGQEEFWSQVFRVIGRFALALLGAGFVTQLIMAGADLALLGTLDPWSQAEQSPWAAAGSEFLRYVLAIVACAFLTHLIAAQMHSSDAAVKASLAAAAERAPTVLLWSLVSMLAVVVGAIFLIVPGVYIALRVFLVVPVAVLAPDKNPIAESWRLTQDSLFRPFVCLLVIVAAIVAVVMLTAIPSLLAQLVGGVFAQTISFGSNWITEAVSLGFSVVPALLLYGWEVAEENAEEARRSASGQGLDA